MKKYLVSFGILIAAAAIGQEFIPTRTATPAGKPPTAAVPATTGKVTLAWDANPVTELVTGYFIYAGIQQGIYPDRYDAGNHTSITITDRPVNVRSYFVATAYNADALESLPSLEVSTIPTIKSGSPTPPKNPRAGNK